MKVLITDCDHANLNQEQEVFEKNGIDFELKYCKTEEDLINECQGYEVFLNQYAPFTRKVFESVPSIKHIVRYGVGVNNIDLEAATDFGVKISNVPDYGMNEVADQAVAMMMALVRKITLMNDFTKNKDWDYTHAIPIFRIPGKTVGIYGLGRIGKTFAKRMSGFEVRRIAYDTLYKKGDIIDGVEIVDFDTLLKESDILSIHSPLTDKTKNAFNIDAIQKMKKSAYIINVSRGGIINEEDLYTALKNKIIAGAAIDVVETEPMKPGSKLFDFENLLVSPHIAWYSEESALELKQKVALEASRYCNNENLWYQVN